MFVQPDLTRETLMGGEFPIDLILFGAIALFLVLRLGNVLGKRTGHQKKPGDMFPGGPPAPNRSRDDDDAEDDEKVIRLPNADNDQADADAVFGSDSAGLAKVRIADPGFQPSQFLEGARMAFEMIVQAYAEGDTKALKPLLSDDVFQSFSDAIDQRADAGHRMEDTLVGIDSAQILEAEMNGREAHITVKFVSKQVNVTFDSENRVVAGEPNAVITVTDIWTFARDTRSRDPNWALIATRTPN